MSGPHQNARFPTTATTLLDALARGNANDVRHASEILARAYYKPIHTYIRLRWRADAQRADDLTQSFFEQVVQNDKLAGFSADRAKLRTYLRRCVDHFVIDADRRRRALKRGGDTEILALDDVIAPSGEDDPEKLFHREWVRHLLELARTELSSELKAKKKSEHLVVFSAIHDHEPPPTHRELADTLGITTVDVNNRLSYARRTYRSILVRLLTQITATPEECRSELEALAL